MLRTKEGKPEKGKKIEPLQTGKKEEWFQGSRYGSCCLSLSRYIAGHTNRLWRWADSHSRPSVTMMAMYKISHRMFCGVVVNIIVTLNMSNLSCSTHSPGHLSITSDLAQFL